MNIATEKAELIRWIESVDSPVILEKINRIRREKSFDFEKEWQNGISISEARQKTSRFIKSLPWKK